MVTMRADSLYPAENILAVISRGFPVILLLALLPFPSGYGAQDKGQGNPQGQAEQQERLRILSGQIEHLTRELEEKFHRKNQLEGELEAAEKRILSSERRLRDLDQLLPEQEKKLSQLRAQYERQSALLKQHKTLLARQAGIAYLAGKGEYLKLLLNQQDPAALQRILRYYEYFHQARADEIAVINDQVRQLQLLESEVRDSTDRLQQTRARIIREKETLQQDKSQRGALLAALRAKIENDQTQLNRWQQDEAKLKELLRGLQRYLQDVPGDLGGKFSARKGQMPWPVSGKQIARFGQQRGTGQLRWNGTLIETPAGTAVTAIHHGRVAFSDWLRGFGQLLIIDHGEGYMSLYGYNKALFKETGEWVDAGDIIALVGDSGGQNQAGLYFEIRHNGKPKNPMAWCRS